MKRISYVHKLPETLSIMITKESIIIVFLKNNIVKYYNGTRFNDLYKRYQSKEKVPFLHILINNYEDSKSLFF